MRGSERCARSGRSQSDQCCVVQPALRQTWPHKHSLISAQEPRRHDKSSNWRIQRVGEMITHCRRNYTSIFNELRLRVCKGVNLTVDVWTLSSAMRDHIAIQTVGARIAWLCAVLLLLHTCSASTGQHVSSGTYSLVNKGLYTRFQPLIRRTHSTADNSSMESWRDEEVQSSRRRRLTYDMRTVKRWIEGHNELRSSLFPSAPLKWDLKIAKFAQQHADSITTTANCAAQFNEDNEVYGENLFWAVYEHGSDPWTVPECFQEWVRQGESYDYDTNTCAEGKDCNTYLQIVWKNSTKIGCGEVFCPYHGDFVGVAQFFVCNYYPRADLEPDHPKPY